MNKKNNWIFLIVGSYLIILGILAFINALLNLDSASPFWFCYVAVFLIGVGILKKNSNLILIQLNIITIPLIFWDIDFFYQLITMKPLWGITNYFFVIGFMKTLGNFITLEHLYVIPVAIIFLYAMGISRKDLWKWSFFEVVLIFLSGLLFTQFSENVNCMFKSCINFISLQTPYYQALWFFAVFLMMIITNYFLVYFFKNSGRIIKRNE